MGTNNVHETPYRFIDMDNHYYEPDDCFSRHLEAKYRDQAIRPLPGGVDLFTQQPREDVGWWALGEQRSRYFRGNLADAALEPGAALGVHEGRKGRADVKLDSLLNPKRDFPASMHKDDRLAVLDEQNIEAALMIPSTGLLVENDFRNQPEPLLANLRSFNRWIEEDWGYGSDQRIFGVPIISLMDVEAATRELGHVAALSARFFYFNMGPAYGHSPADPIFDPLWSMAAEAGLHPVLHVDNSGYIPLLGPAWGENAPNIIEATPLLRFLTDVWRPIQDTVAALLLQDLFGRFPQLQMLIIECGSEWLASALKFIDKAAAGLLAPSDVWVNGRRRSDGKRPSEVFREHFHISPFPEDDIPALTQAIGAERVLFGSDWPHPEGVAAPADYLERLPGLSDEDVRTIMRTNGAQMLGLSPGP